MFGGEIAVQPQLVGINSVVSVNGAGALVIICDRLWLGNLDDHLVRRRPSGLVQLAKALSLDYLPLAQSLRCHDKKLPIAIDPGDFLLFCGGLALHRGGGGRQRRRCGRCVVMRCVAFFLFFFVFAGGGGGGRMIMISLPASAVTRGAGDNETQGAAATAMASASVSTKAMAAEVAAALPSALGR